jgi:hypothetical protein
MIHIVNIIPNSMSGETQQDSEPNLAVNPQNTNDMVATAFTPAPLGGSSAPIYVSTDGGNTWSLRTVVPETIRTLARMILRWGLPPPAEFSTPARSTV